MSSSSNIWDMSNVPEGCHLLTELKYYLDGNRAKGFTFSANLANNSLPRPCSACGLCVPEIEQVELFGYELLRIELNTIITPNTNGVK